MNAPFHTCRHLRTKLRETEAGTALDCADCGHELVPDHEAEPEAEPRICRYLRGIDERGTADVIATLYQALNRLHMEIALYGDLATKTQAALEKARAF